MVGGKVWWVGGWEDGHGYWWVHCSLIFRDLLFLRLFLCTGRGLVRQWPSSSTLLDVGNRTGTRGKCVQKMRTKWKTAEEGEGKRQRDGKKEREDF